VDSLAVTVLFVDSQKIQELDQTMVRLDRFISGVRDGCLLQHNDFELLDYDRLGNVISVKYKSVYAPC
jgi:hypothetical protein